MKRIGFLATVLLATACTSYKVATPEAAPIDAHTSAPPGLARICVLRPHAMAALVPAVVRDNDQLVGATRPTSYFCWYAAPGAHEIAVEVGDDIDKSLGTGSVDRAEVTATVGSRYYLHETLGHLYGAGGLVWVDEKTGLEMADGCDYVELSAVPGHEALPPPVSVVAAR